MGGFRGQRFRYVSPGRQAETPTGLHSDENANQGIGRGQIMGGSGGGRYSGPPSESIQRRIERAREQERQRLNGQVNDLLRRLMAGYNDRDKDKIADHL